MGKATIKYTDGMQFVAVADSGHAVVMDASPDSGGSDTGTRPTEMLLMGIGGCSGMDIVSILKKKRQVFTSFEAHVNGTMSEDHPRKFTDIDIVYVVKGKEISEEAVKRAVQLSMDKYCSVKNTLEGTAKITYSYKIIEE